MHRNGFLELVYLGLNTGPITNSGQTLGHHLVSELLIAHLYLPHRDAVRIAGNKAFQMLHAVPGVFKVSYWCRSYPAALPRPCCSFSYSCVLFLKPIVGRYAGAVFLWILRCSFPPPSAAVAPALTFLLPPQSEVFRSFHLHVGRVALSPPQLHLPLPSDSSTCQHRGCRRIV